MVCFIFCFAGIMNFRRKDAEDKDAQRSCQEDENDGFRKDQEK